MSYKINTLVIVSLVLNLLLSTLFFWTNNATDAPFFIGILIIWAIGLAGLLFTLITGKKQGLYILIVSNMAFIPIGLLGMLGARKMLDEMVVYNLNR